ncbi:MAG: hypothetical protein A2W35_16955 [Chloroflexi bacterium RBG_16_57_11]|nr:MAG: hypothetical protein A2W35_16955 [Chloroflexi bacterium RBG_16_57_11]
MNHSEARISILNSHITDEIFAAFGFETTGWPRRFLWPIFWQPAQIFARLADGVEQNIAYFGLAEAARRLLPRFVDDVKVIGVENIPIQGPLLVASNHPGAYDSVAILANLPRADLKVVVSDVSLLHSLPALDERSIYTLDGVHGRMTTLRNIIRHLHSGGSVLIFATGFVDPDPEVLPGAEEKLGEWSPSLSLALRYVPEAKILPTIVSGVLSPASLHSPLLRMQKEAWKQRKLAEFLQVIQQLVFHRDYGLIPHISYGEPFTAQELAERSPSGEVMPEIIAQARRLLARHLQIA